MTVNLTENYESRGTHNFLAKQRRESLWIRTPHRGVLASYGNHCAYMRVLSYVLIRVCIYLNYHPSFTFYLYTTCSNELTMITMILPVFTNYRQITIMEICHSPKLCNYRVLRHHPGLICLLTCLVVPG